jgi:hypothetical protein
MTQNVIILMWANPIWGPLEWVENRDHFRPEMATNEPQQQQIGIVIGEAHHTSGFKVRSAWQVGNEMCSAVQQRWAKWRLTNDDKLKDHRLVPLKPPLFFHFTLPLSYWHWRNRFLGFLCSLKNSGFGAVSPYKTFQGAQGSIPSLAGLYENPIYRTGPLGYMGWRNRFLRIDSWAP